MTRKMRLELVCGVLLLGVAAAAPAQQPNIKDGLWEVTTTVDMGGGPGARPPQTMQHCVTPQDVKDPAGIGRGMDKSGQCQVTDHKVTGNTASWKLTCKGEGAMSGTGTATYGGTTYTMTSKTTMTHGGQTMNMTVTQSGKYLGPCKK
jgi:hypothetical protein